jgi:glycosyltransferase involved in cell wall biosynthesis
LMFDPTDLDAMRCGIERIVECGDLRNDLIVLGHERVHKFSWDQCAERTLEVYRQIIT